MDPINPNADRIIWLLRQRLLDRAKKARTDNRAERAPSQFKRPTGADAVKALAAVDGLDSRELKRALIQNLLVDQLGDELVNDANFQQVVVRVTDTLEADEAGAKLLDKLVLEMRTAAQS